MNLRPTCNPTLYQQMAGRGTRLYEGKEFCLLIDIVPADSKKVQNLCTAPTLFGVDPALLDKEQKKKLNPDTDLLTLCDSLRGYFTTEAQRMEIETRRWICSWIPVMKHWLHARTRRSKIWLLIILKNASLRNRNMTLGIWMWRSVRMMRSTI